MDNDGYFDAGGVGIDNGNIFGFPVLKEPAISLINVPFDVTTSYGSGTSKAPEAILKASLQVDVYDPLLRDIWRSGITMNNLAKEVLNDHDEIRMLASALQQKMEKGTPLKAEDELNIERINDYCEFVHHQVYAMARSFLHKNQIVGVVGGEHSCSLGLINALSEKYNEFGILQIDAHADLRVKYQGLTNSHASIMFNGLSDKNITKLIQVGVRDLCQEEADRISSSNGRIETWYDQNIKNELYKGKTWDSICNGILRSLPQNVYLSFDIDGLSPEFCPGTGTPVPGGLDYNQAIYLLNKVVDSGRRIIAFDLSEVGASQWDANVGSRVLLKLCTFAILSGKKVNNAI